MNEAEERIIGELEITNRLLARILVKDTGNQTERVVVLNLSGFAPKDIADLLGIKPNVVTATLSNVKRAEAQKQKRVR